MKRKSRAKPKRRNWILRVAVLLLLALAGGVLGWCRWVYVQIESYAGQDQAAPADAIGVFGAAEYDGRPSPVYRARLDHALALYQRGIAPLIITLGETAATSTTKAPWAANIWWAWAFRKRPSSPRPKAAIPRNRRAASPSLPAPTGCGGW